jgi:hypothetical protein
LAGDDGGAGGEPAQPLHGPPGIQKGLQIKHPQPQGDIWAFPSA